MIQQQIELPSLYDHQETFRDAIRAELVKYRAVIACAPPGTGKTRLAKWILGSFANRERGEGQSGYALFAVHRRSLVDNASNSFNESPELSHGLIMSGRETYGGRSVQVASIDTSLSWFCENGEYSSEQTYDLIVFDECHSHHPKLQSFLAAHQAKRDALGLKRPFVLGLSATPQSRGLDDVYKSIVMGPSTKWLIENEYLSPFRYFRVTQGKLKLLVKREDEYTADSVSAAMSGLSGDLVRDWKKHAEGRATVGFFPRLSHAREAQYELIRAGVKAEYVDGLTEDSERQRIFRALNDGDIDYICNVGVVERGTDIPRISCVQVCTAVGSVVRWLQMIGRGSRMHPDKKDCLVLDHADGIQKHGFFDDPVDWSLDWSTRPSKDHEARATVECPSCQAVYRGGKCSSCGYEPTPKEAKAQGLEFSGGEMVEITPTEKPKSKKTNEELMVCALFQCGRSRKTLRQAFALGARAADDQGTDFRVPAKFVVAGRTFRMVPYDHHDQRRRVCDVYPFTTGDYSEENNPYMEES